MCADSGSQPSGYLAAQSGLEPARNGFASGGSRHTSPKPVISQYRNAFGPSSFPNDIPRFPAEARLTNPLFSA
jgi:hypothetical protein